MLFFYSFYYDSSKKNSSTHVCGLTQPMNIISQPDASSSGNLMSSDRNSWVKREDNNICTSENLDKQSTTREEKNIDTYLACYWILQDAWMITHNSKR